MHSAIHVLYILNQLSRYTNLFDSMCQKLIYRELTIPRHSVNNKKMLYMIPIVQWLVLFTGMRGERSSELIGCITWTNNML